MKFIFFGLQASMMMIAMEKTVGAAFCPSSSLTHRRRRHDLHRHNRRDHDHHALFGTTSCESKNILSTTSMTETASTSEESGTGTVMTSPNAHPRRDFLSSMIASSSFIMATNTNIKAATAAESESETEITTTAATAETISGIKERKKPNFSQQ